MIIRQKNILDLLADKEDISVNELSQIFEVSDVTIRADLNFLANKGKIIRTHGRAQLLGQRVKAEHSFELRKKQNYEQKIKIGKEAANLVSPNGSFLLDSSSTVLTMASVLRERSNIKESTVVPTGIWSAIELMGIEGINVLIPGGYLGSTSGSITGLPTNNFLKGININRAFLGAWGISVEKGISDSHFLEVELKKYIIKCAEEIIVLADGSKFEQSGLASYANIENITTLITDSTAPEKILEEISDSGTRVILAK